MPKRVRESARRLATLVLIVAMAVGLTAVSAAMFRRGFGPSAQEAPVGAASLDRVPSAELGRTVTRLQGQLRRQPRDAASWSTLGLAYIEQARLTADPSYYAKAQGVLDRSMKERPKDNEAALAGLGALAAARHDFAGALRWADRALAINAYSMRAHAVRVDALVELGRYDVAWAAVRRADSLRPGIPIFTRYAYVLELRGRPGQARTVLERALDSTDRPGDVAYVAGQLGDLAAARGDYRVAGRHYAEALRADPAALAALDGQARVLAARGDSAGALKAREALVQRVPLPSYVVALGEAYEARGRRDKAREQYAIAGTWNTIAKANGVDTDLEAALVAADHGDRAAALRSARAEWTRRCGRPRSAAGCSVHVDDVLGWALHVNGRDREALDYARRAARTGYRNALFLYHRGMIERSLGRDAAARRSLRAALRLNPLFSEVHAPQARKALS